MKDGNAATCRGADPHAATGGPDGKYVRPEGLIRQLLAQASLLPPHPPEVVAQANAHPATTPAEVLFSWEVDGVRCLLLREHAADHHGISLSPREQEIVRMVAKGLPNKAIAAVLEISVWTVGTHLRRVFGKLGVTSRAAMVARTREWDGPVPPPTEEPPPRSGRSGLREAC